MENPGAVSGGRRSCQQQPGTSSTAGYGGLPCWLQVAVRCRNLQKSGDAGVRCRYLGDRAQLSPGLSQLPAR